MQKKLSKKEKTLIKVIAIVGPTASGKSDLAIKLAKELNGEIISADSRQIYKNMDIGTAKVPKDKIYNLSSIYYCSDIPHYLLDIKKPNQLYTVAQYKKDAINYIKAIWRRKKIPILVGGTGLYIKAVIDNLKIPNIKPDYKLRQQLTTELQNKGLNYLYQKLIQLDPKAAAIIDPHNHRRIIRALEIIYKSNKLFSRQRKQGKKMFLTLKIGLCPPKEVLKTKINQRVKKMIKNGLIQEVQKLIKDYPSSLAAFNTICYKEIISYLKKEISLEKAISLIKINTWQYAKRQLTWFKKDKEIQWFNPENKKDIKTIFKICKQFIAS